MNLPFNQMTFPELYEQELVGPLFFPFAGILLDKLRVGPGDSLLDVACGTGIIARLAAERAGESVKVVGVDSNPGMLAVAARVAPQLVWRQSDAGALPLEENERFDVVACHQGLQFFPDKPAAVKEMRRALAPRGRVGIGTWRPDAELTVISELRKLAERHTGPVNDRRHGFGEPGPIEELLDAAGFVDIESSMVSRTIRFEDGITFARFNAMALVGMIPGAKDFSDERREQLTASIVGESVDLVKSHTDSSGFCFELSSNITTARVGGHA